MKHAPVLLLLAALVAPIDAAGQGRVRALGPVEVSRPLGSSRPLVIRPLSDGRVLVLDQFNRRVFLVDSTFREETTLFDQNTPAPLTFPPGAAHLIAGPGDTTWLIDPPARGFRIIDPDGRVVRRQGLSDLKQLVEVTAPTIMPVLDTEGRLVYVRPTILDPSPDGINVPGDTLRLVRISFRIPGSEELGKLNNGGPRVTSLGPQLPGVPARTTSTFRLVDLGDAWAMTSKGSIAMIRADDFRIDWIDPGDRKRTTPPLPFTRRRYTAEQIGELRRQADSLLAATSLVSRSTDGSARTSPRTLQISTIDPQNEPAFVPNSARADAAGRIWLQLGARMLFRVPQPPIYAIIDESGRVVERVSLPPGTTLVGFWRDRVYLLSMDFSGYSLQRRRY